MEPFIFALIYLGIGYLLYRRKWPEGLLAPRLDAEADRLRRVGRRRILPVPRQNRGR